MTDRGHLATAIALALGDESTTSPNPTVGCVVVAGDGTIVGTGRTEPPGGRHAEIVALDEAGERARGATVYVTLEPCNHAGRTGPCSIALRDAGIARVVVARMDPVDGHGGGLRTLGDAGVRTVVLDAAGWADVVTERFLRRARTGRPWVTLKVAHTPAGATRPSDGRWITGDAARRRVHTQRSRHDAVLVGLGTVLADDPRLDVRHVAAPHGQPRPVVLDRDARTPATAAVVARGALVIVGSGADEHRLQRLRDAGADVVEVERTGDHGVDLDAALMTLSAAGLHDVYAEPGDTLGAALVQRGVVDELVCHRPSGPATGVSVAEAAGTWSHRSSTVLGEDREDVWRPARSASDLVADVADWARRQLDIEAVGLVGSHARGEQHAGSDVDLVLLVHDVEARASATDWLSELVTPVSVTTEQWGAMTSLRVVHLDGRELDLSLTGPGWARLPVDDGTARVVRDGLVVAMDNHGLLRDLVRAVATDGPAPRAA